MDKRSLFFVFALSLTLLGINHYFTSKKIEQKKVAMERLEATIAQRTASLDALPLVRDGEGHWAVKTEGGQIKLPAGGEPVDRQETALVGDLPASGELDLQLVWLTGNPQTPVAVTVAAWKEGSFAPVPHSPPADALALRLMGQNYLPVGVFRQATGEFTPFAIKEELPPEGITVVSSAEEQYFVLEGPYQQLVFSNRGGALVEINLPFETPSLVKEIEFDRRLLKEHPENAQFPKRAYTTAGGKKMEPANGGYYPLLRRTLSAPNGQPIVSLPAHLYALNLVSKYPELAELSYNVTNFTENSITFEARQKHRKITKTFTIAPKGEHAPYVLDLELRIDGDAQGLWLTSGVPEVELLSGSANNELKLRVTRGDSAQVDKLSMPVDSTTVNSFLPDWICTSNGFMGVIIDPLDAVGMGYRTEFVSGLQAPSRLVQIDSEHRRFPPESLPGYQVLLPIDTKGGTSHFRIFAGPFATPALKAADAAFADPAANYHPDYLSSQSYHGWFSFISEPFAKLLLVFMQLFYWMTNSWAAAIVLLTILLRLILYPLSAWSMRSMRKMQKVAPFVQEIQAKYKKEPAKAQAEIMNLYRQHKVNPMSGCFPLLIQMPFLIGMFDLLKSTFELRGASFIPGWIDNLTAPDVVFSWGYSFPLIGNEFHALPIILGVIFYLQSRMTGPSIPVNEMTEQQRQQRLMGNMMTLVFTVMFYSFPSGLNIYWISSMLLGVGQQWLVNRQVDHEPSVPVVIADARKR